LSTAPLKESSRIFFEQKFVVKGGRSFAKFFFALDVSSDYRSVEDNSEALEKLRMRLDDPLDREIVRRGQRGKAYRGVREMLAVDHLSLPAQTRAVKRTKDRLRVALRRMCKPAPSLTLARLQPGAVWSGKHSSMNR